MIRIFARRDESCIVERIFLYIPYTRKGKKFRLPSFRRFKNSGFSSPRHCRCRRHHAVLRTRREMEFSVRRCIPIQHSSMRRKKKKNCLEIFFAVYRAVFARARNSGELSVIRLQFRIRNNKIKIESFAVYEGEAPVL